MEFVADAKSSQPPPLALSEARVVVLQSLNRYVYLVVCRHPKVPILEICPSSDLMIGANEKNLFPERVLNLK